MTTSNKSIDQMDADAKKTMADARAIIEDKGNRTIEEVEGAYKALEDVAPIVERLLKVTGENATKALVKANGMENAIAAIHRPNSPYVPVGTDGVGTDARGNVHAIKSIGEQFVTDKLMEQWLAQVAPGGRAPDKLGADSPGVTVKALIYAGGATSGAPMTWSDQRRDMVVPAPFRPLVLRDLITRLPTNDSVIEYVRITGYTNAAAPVAEATATAGTSGLKPESGMTTEKVIDRVRTIAHWLPATTKILRYAPQIRAFVDSFLRNGLEETLENQMISGSGIGEDLPGILATPGLSVQAYDATGAQPLLTTTRRARTKVTTQGRATPTAYLMNPLDWEAIDLLTNTQGNFYGAGPFATTTPRLWGLPVVESEGMPAGRAIVGDFKTCILWDSEAATIKVGTINDDMIRNMVRILAELDAGFGVLSPKALVDIDLLAA